MSKKPLPGAGKSSQARQSVFLISCWQRVIRVLLVVIAIWCLTLWALA